MNALASATTGLNNRFSSSALTTRRRHGRTTISSLAAYGNRLHKAGRLQEAESVFRLILAHQPNNPVALLSLGIVAQQCGQLEAASRLMERAIEVAPRYHQAHNNLGNVYVTLNRLDEAVACFSRAVEIDPDYADAWFNIGVVLRRQGKVEEAIEALESCRKLMPHRTDVLFELGQCHQWLGDRLQAQIAYRVLLELDPTHIPALNRIGRIVSLMGHMKEAAVDFEKALAIEPDDIGALNGLGDALKRLGRFEESLEALQRASAIEPNNVETISNLASTYQSMGDIERATERYARVLELAPHAEFAEKSSLFVALNRPELSSEELFALHRRLRSRHDRPSACAKKFAERSRDPERKLRIGFIGSDFRTHVVALNIIPLISHYDRSKLEVFLYSQEKSTDRMTEVFKQTADHYLSIGRYSDAEVAEIVERDEIDILLLLAGRFDENRPLIAAYRAAPIQVSFHDCATSGLQAMDYWLTDPILHPNDTQELFTEQLYRLPVYYQYPVQEGLPAITPVPAARNGYVTFGCFNKPEKINDRVISLWSEILKALPSAKLRLKYFNHYSATTMWRHWTTRFAAHGVGENQLDLKAAIEDRSLHLQHYNDIDIALDPFPFNGATTTFESLTMGVPVVTLLGRHFVDRVAASMVTHAGYPELVAADRATYVEIAASLASDIQRLSALRGSMRERLHASPLCDGPSYARSVEDAFRDMWRTWCETGGYRGR